MNNNIYKQIIRDYENLRNKNLIEQKNRYLEVEEKVKGFSELENEIKQKVIETALLQIKNPDKNTVKKLTLELERLEKDKEELLIKAGYKKDYLDMRYSCKICKDQGFIDQKRCKCFNKRLTLKLFDQSGISHVLERENFKSFNYEAFSDQIDAKEGMSPRQNIRDIMKVVELFIKTFDKKNDMNLLFYGKPGLGKTFISNCIAKYLMEKNKQVIYMTAFSMVKLMEDVKFSKNVSEDAKYKYDLLYGCDLLIVDDLGVELSTSFTNSEIFNLINSRLLRGKKNLISTNLDIKDLSNTYTDRVFSRVYQKFTALKFFGKDLRTIL